MTFEHETDFSHLIAKEDICKNCLNFRDFKEKCWFYWQEKKECSQKIKTQ